MVEGDIQRAIKEEKDATEEEEGSCFIGLLSIDAPFLVSMSI